jgi:hypothetical protein
MSLRPGQEWGEAISDPIDPVCLAGDRELAQSLQDLHVGYRCVTGGDLARTIGSHRPRHPESSWRRIPIDRIKISTEHGCTTAVAHVVLRRSWWTGAVIVICNAEFLGTWDVAPRAHPGDGLLDVIEMSEQMSQRARFQAWRRVRSGTHLPHPNLRSRQVETASWEFRRPIKVMVDGHRWGRASQVSIGVRPGDFDLYV